MSNLNPDTCMQQLAVAKKAISDNEAKIKQMKAETDAKEADYNAALDDYNEKEDAFNAALATFNNYKNARGGWYQVGSSNGADCGNRAWGGSSAGECRDSCNLDVSASKYPGYAGQSGGATSNYSRERRGCTTWCECQRPDLNTYNANGSALETAKSNMELAQTEMESKKQIFNTFAARPVPSPQINIACCQNSLTCGDASDCNKITQNCEAKISSMSTEQKAEAEKAAAATAATAAAAAAAAAGQGSVGQKSSNTVSKPTSSSSTVPIIGGSSSIMLCCCILIIVIIIIFMK
jgi:hypothetical protein